MFWIPIAGAAALLIGLIAHGSNKKTQTANDAGTVPGGTGPTPTGGTGSTAPGGTATPASKAPPFIPSEALPPGAALPVDVTQLVKDVVASGNVDLIKAAAAKIRDLYPQQAAQLDALAAQILVAQASAGKTPAGGTSEPGGIAGQKLGPGGVQKMTQAEALTLSGSAMASKDPKTMRDAAAKLRASGYVDLANTLDGIANDIGPSGVPGATVPAVPNMQAAIDLARAAARAVGDDLTVQDIDDILHGKIPQFPRPGMKLPTLPQVVNPPLIPTDQPGKPLAQQLALGLKFAKKGTSSEPIAIVRQFQAQEFLPQDGHYGSTVAIVLADKYGIVPPQAPMYWGKKNDFASIAPDKANYRAAMMKHAQAEPQRRDEWTNAANQTPK